MSSPAASFASGVSPAERLEVLLDKVAEADRPTQRDRRRIVDILREIDHDELVGATGARSVPGLVAWMTGVSPRNAETIAAIAAAIESSPVCEGHAGGPVLVGSGRGHPPRRQPMDPTRTTPRWPPTRRSTSCATRSSWNRDPNLSPSAAEPGARSARPDEQSATWRITLPHDEAAPSTPPCSHTATP